MYIQQYTTNLIYTSPQARLLAHCVNMLDTYDLPKPEFHIPRRRVALHNLTCTVLYYIDVASMKSVSVISLQARCCIKRVMPDYMIGLVDRRLMSFTPQQAHIVWC